MSTSALIRLLAFRTALDPHAIAIQKPERARTFRALHHSVRRISQGLRAAGIRPGQRVATTIADGELDWVFTLALAHEAASSCSNPERAAWGSDVSFDWSITDADGPVAAGPKALRIDARWLESLPAPGVDHRPMEWTSPDACGRIILTSGTTGSRKAVALSEAIVMSRALDTLKNRGCINNFSLMRLSSAAQLNVCVSALMTGTPIYFTSSPQQAVEMIERLRPDGLFGSPLQIAGLVKVLQSTGRHLESLRIVRMAGAAAGPKLLESVARLMTPNILCMYGSTEAGSMGTMRPSAQSPAANVPDSNAEVQVVDDADAPVAAGVEGRVRVRTPLMVHSYVGNPEATAASFKGGWFYPGDRGVLKAGGMLELTGREGEVLNRGGVKFNAAIVDDFMAAFAGVQDAAVFLSYGRSAAGSIIAAVVAGPDFDMAKLKQAAFERFTRGSMPDAFVRVNRIPRTANGKVQRAALARALDARRAA